MAQTTAFIDTTELKTKGVQVIRNFFPEPMVRELQSRAREIIALRAAGKLTTNNQDSKGLPLSWFRPLMRDELLLSAVTSAIGPNVCTAGQRILAKDKHFKYAVHVHQDWPYAPGGTNKLTTFIPLTRMNADNGGIVFLEESHQYGPVTRGAIDLAQFPPMKALCPNVEVGDIILCDFLTWHYSEDSANGEERILLQFNYQPADDASSIDVVAGQRSHDKLLLNRGDAVKFPESEVSGAAVRALLGAGETDKAHRYALGLVNDDDQHSSAALQLAEILSNKGDPVAIRYLELARVALRRQLEQLARLDRRYGLDADMSASNVLTENERGAAWTPLDISWKSEVDGQPDPDQVACTVMTSPHAWGYGVVSTPFQVNAGATIRVMARSRLGKIGFCLIGAESGELVSDQHHITPEMDEAAVAISAFPDQGPLQLVVRNFDDEGTSGQVDLKRVDIFMHT